MCGIYGTTFEYSDELVKQKIQTLKHRGPDYFGVKKCLIGGGKSITFAHARLSILDLDPRSNQPFVYNDSITIVFNGEVYNFSELKNQYLKDVALRTTSDTEVICAMYEKYGKSCVKYLNGMFAFVVLDKKRDVLFGARDRLGKKPFYYRWNEAGIEFASQPKAILLGNKFTVSADARQFYLFNGYIPDPYCIWDEVKKLRAGHCFEYSISLNKLHIEKYWDIFANSCSFTVPKSYDEAKEVVSTLLDDAVKIRLRADVPVGMFLSGGIDSSLTSAVVARNNGNICAYTIGFDEHGYDESKDAQVTAKYLNIPIVTTMCKGDDMLEMFDELSEYYDEPFGDFSMIPTSLLSKVTRRDVTVAIGGDGGDEMFMGYSSYKMLKDKEQIYKLLPKSARKMLYNVLKHTPLSLRAEFLRYNNIMEQHAYREGYGNYGSAALYSAKEIAEKLPDLKYFDEKRGVRAASDYDIKHYLNSCINTKTDRASMRFSLELRSPLMDYRLTEYSRLLPYEYMFTKETGGKRILKDILYDIVPKEMMDRPKHGFSAPVGKWFRNNLRQDFVETLSESNIRQYVPELDAAKVTQYVNNFLSNAGETISQTSFFKIYTYLKWMQHYM
jgi:asparagine synthase (glutamine-hydrolysing)